MPPAAGTTESPSRTVVTSNLFLIVTTAVMFGPYPQIFAGVDTLATGAVVEKSYLLITKTILVGLLLTDVFRREPIWNVRRLWHVYSVFAFLLLSSALSDEPYISFRGAFEFMLSLVFAVVVSARKSSRGGILVLYGALTLSLALSYINVVLVPSWGVHQASDVLQNVHAGLWRGVFGHKNLLAQIAALHVLMTVFAGPLIFSGRFTQCLCLAFSSFALAAANSTTATLALLISLFTGLFLRMSTFLRSIGLLIISAVVLLATLFPDAAAQTLVDLTGRDATLSGRTLVWRWVLDNSADDWLFGRGYMNSAELNAGLQYVFGRATADVHNAYLEWGLTTGVAGLFMLCMLLLCTWRALTRLRPASSSEHEVFATLIVLWLTSGLSEVSPLRPGNGLFLCGLTAVCFLLRGNIPVAGKPGS